MKLTRWIVAKKNWTCEFCYGIEKKFDIDNDYALFKTDADDCLLKDIQLLSDTYVLPGLETDALKINPVVLGILSVGIDEGDRVINVLRKLRDLKGLRDHVEINSQI